MIWLDKYQDLCDIGKEWKLISEKKGIDEWVKIAERLVKKHGGVLPCQAWLQKHGYSGLAQMICKYSERFSHIKQKKIFKTVEEHIADAERLEKEHGGILPSQKWLRGNGHGDLALSFRSHPKRFAHIKQENLRKTVKEHVIDAERLSREHDGVLPNQTWLQKHGYSGLAIVLRKHPKRFAHIEQEKPYKTIEEHVADAEKLAREHGGVLPCQAWLQKHGYSGLVSMDYSHPERFAHIKQENFRKTPEDHIADAEKLARDCGGVLPNQKWLMENGYSRLANAIYKHPERFAHIRQKKLCKTIEEHVIDAESLAREHDGILPSLTWLRRNGRSGLALVIRNHSKPFAHIRSEHFDRRRMCA